MKLQFLSFAILTLSTLAAPAQAPCETCRPDDEKQIGEYVAPEIPSPRTITPNDPRGREIPLPLPGDPSIYHRPGAGVFIGEAGQGNNVFVNGDKSKATLGIKRDF